MEPLNEKQRELLARYHFKVLNEEKKQEAEKLINNSEEARRDLDNMESWSAGRSVPTEEGMKKYWPFVSLIVRELSGGIPPL